MIDASLSHLPRAFRPPDDPAMLSTWLDWLDGNRLAPAAARMLTDVRLPEDVQGRLDVAYAQARAQWLVRKTALQRFLALMAQEPAQPVILLKGAALALTLYDDPAIRPMNDVDLLVRSEHLPEVLRRMRESYAEEGLAPGSDVGYLHHFVFTDPATGTQLEVHKTLPLVPAPSHLEWFLQQTQSQKLQGFPILTLTPEAQLLHAAAHAVLEHGSEQGAVAIWFYDIDRMLRRWGKDLNWEETLVRAQALKWEAALQQAIRLARDLFDTPLPRAIQAWMELPIGQLSGYNLFRRATSPRRSTSLTALHILSGLSWSQRIQQTGRMLFPSRAYMQNRYPGIPWLLTYPYRWFDATRKLLPALFRK